MQRLRTGIIGMGNMGSKYAAMLAKEEAGPLELSAVTRVRPERLEGETELKGLLQERVTVYPSADALFDEVEKGRLWLDAVIIATPHYAHEEQAKRAFSLGLHVLCDKPSGVYTRQARQMEEACGYGSQSHGRRLVFASIFNQRTNPLYRKLKEAVESGRYGKLKRFHWVVTDWYRPDAYYSGSTWRATWKGDGGGTLLNQCPHNLDLLQWICGMPVRVQAFCHEGKYHAIEVEDEVTAYLEWADGATGVFIASTGEAPGINHLEIVLEDALLVCENGKLRIEELGCHEPDYRRNAKNGFDKPDSSRREIAIEGENRPYLEILTDFGRAITEGTAPLASGREARNSLLLSNACYLSSWEKSMCSLPKLDSQEEKSFEKAFEQWLVRKGGVIHP